MTAVPKKQKNAVIHMNLLSIYKRSAIVISLIGIQFTYIHTK